MSTQPKIVMDKKRLRSILKHMEKTGQLPYGGNGLCNVMEEAFGANSVEYSTLQLFEPDGKEMATMKGKWCITYWASGVSNNLSALYADTATNLRKTIVALMIAMA